LNKPFDPNEVWLRICNLLETRFLHLELQSQNMLLEERVLERTAQLETTLAQLHATQSRIIRQERFGALGVMASGIAHDFNNSLTAILGFGELLLDRPDRMEYLRQILTAAQDARQTVYRLREFYRGENATDTQVAMQLNKIVEHSVLLTRPRWSNQALASGIKISVETALGELPLLRGNPAELREMLMNLVFNAVDAMPHGGTITVRTRALPDTIILEVIDTGIGMDAQTAAHCMEPFFTTKGEKGTGLGLAVVYGTVQRHRGGIEVQSAPGEGTTFTLRFPVFAGAHLPKREAPVPAPEEPLRILMVDDQPVICELLSRLLTTDGHSVDAVGGGGAALARCRAHEYDLVITDQAMPGMSGEQLADVIKQLMPRMPVILLTGFDDLPEGPVHNFAGVDLMLNKPVTLTDLRRGILKVMTMRARPAVAA
jgi:signal transduction histidine kinase/ActR/RegA family two-component response regulator